MASRPKRRRMGFLKLCNPLLATRVKADMIEVEIDARQLKRPKHWNDLTEAPRGFSGSPLLTITQEKGQPLLAGAVVTNFVTINEARGYFEARPLAACLRDDGTAI